MSIRRSSPTMTMTGSAPSRCPTRSIRCAIRWRNRSHPATTTNAREISDRRVHAAGVGIGDKCLIGTGLRRETAMATAQGKHHDYHLVDPSPWPAVGSVSAFIMAVGAVTRMHHMLSAAPIIFRAGIIALLYT